MRGIYVINSYFQYVCGPSNLGLPVCDAFVDLSVRRAFVDLSVRHSASGPFHDYIAISVQKGRRLVGMCFRNFENRQSDYLLKIYKTYILPPIMFASQHWSSNLRYEVNEQETVQHRFVK